MAATPAVRKARRSLTFLLVIVVGLAGLITLGVFRSDATWTPKLALDLQGGTQILLAPKLEDGESVNGEQLDQAVAIIRQRVNASGVSEAEVTTQGGQNISVAIPGKADDATLQRIQASAKLDFRPVLRTDVAGAAAEGTEGAEGDASEATVEGSDSADDADISSDASDAGSADDASTDASTESTDEDPAQQDDADLYPEETPESPSDEAWITPALQAQYDAYVCDSDEALNSGDAPSDRAIVTCDDAGVMKYILGPVELGGEVITDAVAQADTTQSGATTGGWVVQMTMNKEGTKTFGEISTRLYGQASPLDQFAFVLDGNVVSAPRMQAQIMDGRPSISGDFTQETAEALADQLKFGALPIGFEVQSQEDISATLGSNQLQVGLLTGLVGLLLVVGYSLFQYRVLGSVTIASLVVAGVLTYLLLTFFSWRQGYRLSLAGVTGIIVSVGFTADSFILYFERIRDSIRDGFHLEQAIEQGWKKALRTILASDAIFILAAVILFIFAVANVRGFAFTLGLTTLVDIIVVMLFTHPIMTLLGRTRFYREGHPASGLDPRSLGAVYRGRLSFREPAFATKGASKKNLGSRKEAERRQTIAERKAAEAGVSTGKES
ncbi:protein translocase subunit SecD [Leucobacter sp. GX24907]